MNDWDDEPPPPMPWELHDQAAADPAPTAAAKGGKGGGSKEPTIPELLVAMASERFDIFLGSDGEPYAVQLRGSSIAMPLRGRTGLKQRLAMLLWESRGKVPSGQASADTLNVLEGKALDKPRRRISLRVDRHDDKLMIDMGGADGRIIEVSPDGWRIIPACPALFRRTALTGAMPDPDPSGTLAAFRAGLNVSEENFRLIVGWMLHAFIPDEPHPVLGLLGEQGTAKTTAAKQIGGIVDPSPAPTRTAPKDLTDWAVTASGSWLVTLDNISEIKPWFSDALCKAVTGDAMTKRALYTDGDLSVLVFLRPVIMTSIDAGALRGDLAERLLLVELERIPKESRRTEKDVRTAYEQHQAQTLGAMLNLLSQVLKVLPDVEATDLPRMADFTRFLVALDQVTGWNTRADYEETFADLADAVISGDPFADEIRKRIDGLINPGAGFDGTASELLKWAEPKTSSGDGPLTMPRGWPKTPHGASGALKRITPALMAAGISIEFYREGHKRTRKIRIWRADAAADAADALAVSGASAARVPFSAPGAPAGTRCCGGRAQADGPLVNACTLCPKSPTYWKKAS
ncbi:hypothetical protein JNW88_17055 [Micromonospora sp. ATA32]|nr:hypothetical protein [Micromonospora sp. ATA32]